MIILSIEKLQVNIKNSSSFMKNYCYFCIILTNNRITKFDFLQVITIHNILIKVCFPSKLDFQ